MRPKTYLEPASILTYVNQMMEGNDMILSGSGVMLLYDIETILYNLKYKSSDFYYIAYGETFATVPSNDKGSTLSENYAHPRTAGKQRYSITIKQGKKQELISILEVYLIL